MRTRDDPRVIAVAKAVGLKGPRHFEERHGRRLDDLSAEKAIEIMERRTERRLSPEPSPYTKEQRAKMNAEFFAWQVASMTFGEQRSPDGNGEDVGQGIGADDAALQPRGERPERLRFGDLDALRPAGEPGR